MATSRVPAAIDALLTAVRARPSLDSVEILDGPSITNLSSTRRLYIGWQPGSDTAVSLTQAFAGAGARTRDEDFDIACYAEALSGDTDLQVARTGAFALVAEVESCLRATDAVPDAPTLGGTVLWAHLTAGNLLQGQDAGALAGVLFTVRCRARI